MDTENKEEAMLYIVSLTAASIIGVAGNCLTIGSLLFIKANRNLLNVFLINLALGDLLVTGAVMPNNIAGLILGKAYFDDHPLLCKVVATICAPGCLASMYSICWISISRYYFICKYPIYLTYFTKNKVRLIIASIWALCFIMHSPNHLGWGETRFNRVFRICTIDMEVRSYSMFYGGGLILATCVPFYFYCKIYHTIRNSQQARNQISGAKDRKTAEENRILTELKIARTSFKIYLVYIASWISADCLFLWGIDERIPLPVYWLAAFLAHANSTWTFFVYVYDNKNMRQSIAAAFCGCLKRSASGIPGVEENGLLKSGMSRSSTKNSNLHFQEMQNGI